MPDKELKGAALKKCMSGALAYADTLPSKAKKPAPKKKAAKK